MSTPSGTRSTVVRSAGPTFAALGLAAAVVAALVAGHLFVGRSELTPDDVWRVLTGRSTEPAHELVVLRFRLPRVLVGLGAGALLAVSGVLVQAVVRNPLAEPSTTGIGSGAALAVVATLVLAPGRDLVHVAALAGAVLTGGLLLLVGRGQLALTGILLGAVWAAITSLLLVVDSQPIGVVLRWLVGSLNARTVADWTLLWPWLLVVPPLAWLLAPRLNVWSLGEPAAVSLGVRPGPLRAVTLLLAVLAGAAAIAAAGAVAFVGLVAPHLARLLVGADHRVLVPAAAFLGAALLSVSDLLAFAVSIELPGARPDVAGVPVGAVTALLGAPFLIHLVRREVR